MTMTHTPRQTKDYDAIEALSGSVMGTLCGYVEQFGTKSQKLGTAALVQKILQHKKKGREIVPWSKYRQELFEICGDWLWLHATNFWRMYEAPKMRVPIVVQQKVLDVTKSSVAGKFGLEDEDAKLMQKEEETKEERIIRKKRSLDSKDEKGVSKRCASDSKAAEQDLSETEHKNSLNGVTKKIIDGNVVFISELKTQTQEVIGCGEYLHRYEAAYAFDLIFDFWSRPENVKLVSNLKDMDHLAQNTYEQYRNILQSEVKKNGKDVFRKFIAATNIGKCNNMNKGRTVTDSSDRYISNEDILSHTGRNVQQTYSKKDSKKYENDSDLIGSSVATNTCVDYHTNRKVESTRNGTNDSLKLPKIRFSNIDDEYDICFARIVMTTYEREEKYPWKVALYFCFRRMQEVDVAIFHKFLCAVMHCIICSRSKVDNKAGKAIPEYNFIYYSDHERLVINSILRLILYSGFPLQFNLIKYAISRILMDVDQLNSVGFHLIPHSFPIGIFQSMDFILNNLPTLDMTRLISTASTIIETAFGKVEYEKPLLQSFSGYDSFLLWAKGIANGTIRPSRVAHLMPELENIFTVSSTLSMKGTSHCDIDIKNEINKFYYGPNGMMGTNQFNAYKPSHMTGLHNLNQGIVNSIASSQPSLPPYVKNSVLSRKETYQNSDVQAFQNAPPDGLTQMMTSSDKNVKNFVHAIDSFSANNLSRNI